MGEAMASHLLFADPQFEPRFLARHLRHQRTPDRAGRPHPGSCRRAAWATLAVEARFKDVRPGDVILLNDPYHGGSHLPDLTAFVPIFDGERRLLWTIVRAHQSDIGGATHGGYNPGATEIWQEGLRVPPIKLYEAGRLRDDLLDLLALNIRNPREFRGDLAAMVGAAHLGERRLSRLFAEFGGARGRGGGRDDS